MKRVLWIVFVIILGKINSLSAQTVSFNFSAGSQPVSGWINVIGDPSVSIVSGTDPSTGISVTSINQSNWAPSDVAAFDGLGAAGGTFFPSAVMLNHWFQFGSPGNYNAALPQLQIAGLNKDSVYTLKMAGSSTSTSISNPTHYTVTGLAVHSPIDVNNHNNTVSGAIFTNIAPDANGMVRVYINTVPGTDVADISGIQIIRGRTFPPVVSIVSPVNNSVLPEDGSFSISANASQTAGGIAKVEFFVGSTKIGESATSPYSVTWLSPDAGAYTITARAIGTSGDSVSAIVNVSVEPSSSFWSMTGNIRANADNNFVGTVDTNRLAFRTNNLERMSILKDGSIGVGTKNTFGYLFAVNGNAIFNKVRVKTAGTWPDYVFKKGYVLPGLAELEQYVQEHHHLPGIVPEEEVKKDGVDIVDQQAALLKKLEELTLYLIEENKRLKDQNSRLEEQQRQIDELKKLIQEKK